jgi:hypothetical protein
VLRIVADAALGLEHAHAARLVHRDVSPENLFVTRVGLTKVIDFGLAHRTSADTQTGGQTVDDALRGKLLYMAPEQLRGEDVDARADLFSLGVVTYWLLSGGWPFAGRTDAQIMKALLDAPARRLRETNRRVPAAVDALVAACLEKEPQRRIRSAGALHDALARLLAGLPRGAPEPASLVDDALRLPPGTDAAPRVAAVPAVSWPDEALSADEPFVPSTHVPADVRTAGGFSRLPPTMPEDDRRKAGDASHDTLSSAPVVIGTVLTRRNRSPQPDLLSASEMVPVLEPDAAGSRHDASSRRASAPRPRRHVWGSLMGPAPRGWLVAGMAVFAGALAALTLVHLHREGMLGAPPIDPRDLLTSPAPSPAAASPPPPPTREAPKRDGRAARTSTSRAARHGDKAKGTLVVRSRPAADVWLSGARIGRTPIEGLVLKPGSYTVRLVSGKKEKNVTFDVRPGPRPSVLSLDLR